MWIIWIICGLIIVAVVGLSLFTTHKGYQYKHTVDPLPEQPYQENEKETDKTDEGKKKN